MNLVSNKNKKIFLSRGTKLSVDTKVDLILSPEFYWVRVFDIPVKSITQARHVLPTLFEDILETTSELSYQVIKLEENKYLCFAYINKRIYEEIKSSGINLSLVDSIYFAQNECTKFSSFKLDDKSYLYTEDKILVKVPNSIAFDAIDLIEEIDSIELSSNKIDIKLYNNVLNQKQIYSLILIFVLISAINFYKLIDYKNENSNLDEKIEQVKKDSKLPNSMIQTNSILAKNKKDIDLEFKKRKAVDYIIENKSFKLKSLNLEKDSVELVYENADKTKVERFLSKEFKILSSKVKALDLNIKVKLWKD